MLRGKHTGPNKGFGVCHIWAEHRREMEHFDLVEEAHVPIYVAKIVCAGTPLHFEGSDIKATKLIAVRSSIGLAILQLRPTREETYWSIVTAYASSKKHGVRVGAVLDVFVPAVAASP
ncbi:hypothetical protein V5F49_05065 [Xanthobacter sp. V3C-3]|uniref:hypothetical protein n=1 Tax=Xanthobacter lutulentifluminis TaxID=3119935 RepID=UPI003728E4A6